MSGFQEKRPTVQEPAGHDGDEVSVPSARSCYKPIPLRTSFLVTICLINFAFGILAFVVIVPNAHVSNGDSSSSICSSAIQYEIVGVSPDVSNTTAANATTANTTSANTTVKYTTGEVFPDCPVGYICKEERTGSCGPGAPPVPHWTDFLQISTGQYFVGTYLATLVAVLYRMMWATVFGNLKRMEPYYKMAHAGGALAEDSVCLSTSGISGVKTVIGGIRHDELRIGGIVTSLVALSVPFSSEALSFKTTGACTADAGGDDCKPSLHFQLAFAYVLGGIAVINGAFIAVLTHRERRRTTGVHKDPSSIIATANLMRHPSVSTMLDRIPPATTLEMLEEAFKGSRWSLRDMRVSDGRACSGFMVNEGPVQQEGVRHRKVSSSKGTKFDYVSVPSTEQQSSFTGSRRRCSYKSTIKTTCFGAFLAIVLAVITYYRWTTNMESGFEHFMDSQSTGLRFLWTTIGLLISIGWKRIDSEVRILEPYRRLLLGSVPAKHSIMVSTDTTPFVAFYQSMRRKQLFTACISLNAVLAEVLTITLGSVPYSSKTSYNGFEVSTYISQAILSVMLLSLVWLAFKPSIVLPRSPQNIAAVMTYLHGSSLLEEIEHGSGSDRLTTVERTGHIGLYTMQMKSDSGSTKRLVIDRQ